jgi:sucrose-6-phosphate hydrolase SacC (GH32 family)
MRATIQIVDDEMGGWGHVNVDHILLTDRPAVPPEPPAAEVPVYTERLRPQFHFTAAKNWINDPNGLVFYAGEYHLFFQHNPSGIKWGNMTWGHAVSPDLVHWTQLPNALTPDDLGTMYSGSAVVDWKNTSGFGTNGQPPLVAMYTAAGGETPGSKGKPFTQCIAYSTDKGRTWTKYDHNPVIGQIGKGARDPKVIWHEPTGRWVMVLYKSDGTSTFSLYNSPDLKTWTHLHDLDIKGSTECPDLFPLPLDGDANRPKWVLTAANGRYLVGAFDGKTFTPEQGPQKVDFGHNYYPVQTSSDTPDGRRFQIAWMNNGRWPRMPFNGQMSFPTELTLRTTPDGPRLFRYPIREIETLHAKEHRLTDVALTPDKPLPLPTASDLLDIETEIELGTATEITLTIRGQRLTYSTKDQTLEALGKAPLKLPNNRLHLRILLDRTSIETFADHGRVSLTSCYLPIHALNCSTNPPPRANSRNSPASMNAP